MRKIRWGILGTAKIGVSKVIPAIQQSEVCQVVAIASREPARAKEVASRLGIARAHGSYEELIRDPEVDALYIPLPNHLHVPWTLEAARAGKHVLCEKPAGLNSTEVEQMVTGCRRLGVKFMEAFMYRLHPQWVRVGKLVQSGRIGELSAIQSFFSYRNLDYGNIRNIREYGGGGLMDIGCYCVNLSRMLFQSEPMRTAAIIRRDPKSGVDILTSGLLEFERGHAGFTCATQVEPDQRVHITGSEGRILIEIPFNIPPDRPTRLFVTAGGEHPTNPNTEVLTIPPANQYTIQGELFSKAILDDADVPVTGEDSIANMRVLDQLFATALGA